MSSSLRAAASLLIVVAVALVGLGGWGLSKTRFFHGESKRAAASTATTEQLVTATQQPAAAAAAYVTKIGEANATAPASRERDFIGRAVGITLGYLPKPDPQVLLEAERLKVAVLEGRLAEANALNATAMQRADTYQRELTRALAAKRASDLALEQAAAEARGAEQQAFWLLLLALAAGGLYVWTKWSHVSPLALAATVRDLRTGATEPNPAIAALDANLTPFQQANVALMHWLRRKLSALKD